MKNIFYFNCKDITLIISFGILSIILSTFPSIILKDTLKGTLFNIDLYQESFAQQHPLIHSNNNTLNNKINQNNTVIAHASGHFANNQIKDGIVTWIQGGLWDLLIKNSTAANNNENISHNSNTSEKPNNMTAIFNANFTMIKPDGSLSHSHQINNFNSTNVIFAGNDIIVTGIADIHSNAGLEFKQVPMTVHLMGKKVLGLTINVEKTNGHFSSSNEMFGTLISGIGLNKTR